MSDKEIQNQISILNEGNIKTNEEAIQHLKKIIQLNQIETKKAKITTMEKLSLAFLFITGLVFFLTISRIMILKKQPKKLRIK